MAYTSTGRLFRLVLTAVGHKYHISSHAFYKPAPALSLFSILPAFRPAPAQPVEGGNINSIIIKDRPDDMSGKDVWVLIDARIQRWTMSVEGWEELTLDEDISLYIGPEVRAWTRTAADLDLELLDLKITE